MTNFDVIKESSPEEVAKMILPKCAELESKYLYSDLDAFDIIDMLEIDFADWLNREIKFNDSEVME